MEIDFQVLSKMNRRGFEVSFAWLFAMIVGAFILFLAIYGVVKLMNVQEGAIDAEAAKKIGVVLNSLESGFETSTKTKLTMPVESRIFNKCDTFGDFGIQSLRVSQLSFKKWTKTDYEPTFYNRYLFSEGYEEGKVFYMFFKPFEFPFKVSDLIYMTSADKKYCFSGLDDDLEDIYSELSNLGQSNILLDDDEAMDCKNREDVITVCFGSSGCDIEVGYSGEGIGSVKKDFEKKQETMYFYSDALMYAAIFSDKYTYECQLTRLMKRVNILSEIYLEKAAFVSRVGCNSRAESGLSILSQIQLEDSSELRSIIGIVEGIKDQGNCKLW